MKKLFLILVITFRFALLVSNSAEAQCSICAKTTQQMGEKPAKGFNTGILYLMFTPFAIVGLIGYRYWKNNKV